MRSGAILPELLLWNLHSLHNENKIYAFEIPHKNIRLLIKNFTVFYFSFLFFSLHSPVTRRRVLESYPKSVPTVHVAAGNSIAESRVQSARKSERIIVTRRFVSYLVR